MLASESRKAKLEIKAAGRLLNTAQIEQESRVPDKLYLDLKGLQHEKLHNARLTTLALDIIALTRNQKTRIAIASKDSAEYYFLLSGLGELVRLGIFSDFAAISEACKKGLSNATS
jgi:hypothetical protein